MDKIIFINAIESPFTYNRTIDIQSTEIKKDLSLGVRSELFYAKGLDIVQVKFYLIIKSKEDQVLSYDVTLAFKIDSWGQKVESLTPQEVAKEEEVKYMLDIAVGFMRGALYVYEKNTPIQGLNLPILSLDELLKNIRIHLTTPR
ncbi:MAG: hypothetical protein IKW27_06270 [Bacteroidales bacterium]|nr:hypothetical protein [Bacteroidales bacterium]